VSDLLARWLADGSVPELPPLPPSLSVEDDAGVSWLLDAVQGGLRPDPRLNVSEWADTHRMLSGKGSAEPGRYRTSRAPFLREIMDSLSPSSPVQRVVFMKGAQIGGSELGNNWLGYIMACAPGPVMAVQPTVELAKRFSKQRVDQLIEATPVLRAKVKPSRARDSGNTILQKDFAGGTLVLTGANSAVGLRSMPARYLFLDEVDAYPADVESEGDPIDLAEARTKTYSFRRKMLLVSTPTTEGSSKIEAEYLASDQRRYFVPCPHCGHMQWLKFENLRWQKGQPETAGYHCEECGAAATEAHKTAMLAGGEWRETVECNSPLVRGYHVSSLYAPVGWMSWSDIAAQWDKIRDASDGKAAAIKTFRNTTLGETWRESGEAPGWQRLYDRRETWTPGHVPHGAVLLTAGVDVQRAAGGRLEASVWGWGRNRESWLVDHIVIPGSPFHSATWDRLAELLESQYPHEAGGAVPISLAAVDSGDGVSTSEVYAFVRKMGSRRCIAVKGRDDLPQAIGATAKVDIRKSGKRIGWAPWLVGSSYLKGEFYGQLRLDRPTEESGEPYPRGYVHLPSHVAGEALCKQLVAEELQRVKLRNNKPRLRWVMTEQANEALDCRVYARAAASLLGMDRWADRRWTEMEGAIASRSAVLPDFVPEIDEAEHADELRTAPAPVAPPAPVVARPRPAVRRSGYFGGWR
jgi:phage terminase large subunit GpA-like protein